VSIGSNIAEGAARLSDKDFRRFMGIALGSASELEYQLLLSKDLSFIDEEDRALLEADAGNVKRMLSGLIRSLDASLSDSG
jgi:four helix bundle protein